MAGYFSNHSQSRFLANSTVNSASTTTATATTQSPVQPSPPTQPRSRVTSSKHFSTFVSNAAGDEKSQGKDKASGNRAANGSLSVHPLRNTWVFWFRQQRAPGNKITNYEEGIKKISAFSSVRPFRVVPPLYPTLSPPASQVESFWSLWTHVHPPSSLQPTTDYLLFHSGIRRPVWEDPLNLSGGKWIIRLRKGVADRLWEGLVLAVIGDQFDGIEDGTQPDVPLDGTPSGDWPEICGCTISVRQNEDIISLWNRRDGNAKSKEKIKETIRRVLNLPATTVMEYKSNNDSMQDKSSFRVNQIDRTPLS
ncbi:eukaryotic translation initiation factor 4E class II [Trametes gibbosa]|nr:eukaryotic translation initiation factor 4E class II [Trametes gibbosa]